MDVRFCLRAVLLEAGTISREANVRSHQSGSDHNALSSARKKNSCFSVDKDLHGWRSLAQNSHFTSIKRCAARFTPSANSLAVVHRELMSRVVIEDSYQRNARLGCCF